MWRWLRPPRALQFRSLWPAALCASLVLCGCGGQPEPHGSDRKGAEGPGRPVELAVAGPRPMRRTIAATGSLLAQERSLLSAKVSGRLQELNVDIGAAVRKGDLLAQIEPRDYELGLQQAAAALAEARASVGLPPFGTNDSIRAEEVSAVKRARAVLDEARKTRERTQSLSASGIASGSELDSVEAAYAVASTSFDAAVEEAQGRIAAIAQRRAELRLAEKRLADASLRAPFDGIIQSRRASPGEFVASGAPVLELVQSGPLRLRLQVTERDAPLVQLGQPVQFQIEGDTNVHAGRIERLSPALDEDSRMLYVEAEVPQQAPLRPGLFVRAQIIISEGQPALAVPERALLTFAGLEKVVTVQTNRALEVLVTTGRREGGYVEVLEGLKTGQPVVLDPAGLRTGAAVTVQTAASREARLKAPSGG